MKTLHPPLNHRVLSLAQVAGLKSVSETALSPSEERFACMLIEQCAELFNRVFTDEQYQRRIDRTIIKHFTE